MIAAEFLNLFDEDGRYIAGDGTELVCFVAKGGNLSGKLEFRQGMCVSAKIDGGAELTAPNGSPISGFYFLLDVGEKDPLSVAVDQGKITPLKRDRSNYSKLEFLKNFQIARNLFTHPQIQSNTPEAFEESLLQSAIWLTPKSVAGFQMSDFPELNPVQRRELSDAVKEFLAVANQVPPAQAATSEQFKKGSEAFIKILKILGPYILQSSEQKLIEKTLQNLPFQPWVINWDYELRNDSTNFPAVWLNVFVDMQRLPQNQLGTASMELRQHVREAFADAGIDRTAYIRMKTPQEHKAGA